MGKKPMKSSAPLKEGRPLASVSSIPSANRKNPLLKMQKKSASLPSLKKKVKKKPEFVRRSGRLQNVVVSTQNQSSEPVIEEIDVSGSDRDEPQVHQEQNLLRPVSCNRGLEEKVDHVIQLVETQQETLEALKSELSNKRSSSSQSANHAELRYKSMYIESQKKIEALEIENNQLDKKLDVVLGKLEVYENGARLYPDMLEKLKDVMLVSNLTKYNESVRNISSSQMLLCGPPGNAAVELNKTPARRKKTR